MLPLRAPDVLALWEQGRARHAIDRALLLFAAACPDLPADRLADLPLGQRNAALLRLRHCTFGPEIRAYIDCPGCGERMELALQVDMFLPPRTSAHSRRRARNRWIPLSPPDQPRPLRAARSCGRGVGRGASSRTLLRRRGPTAPRRRLSTVCSRRSKPGSKRSIQAPISSCPLVCESCAHAWAAPFDIAAVLWDEVDARARALLAAVHTLARAYGWSERDVLALGEQRRAAYLDMVTA